MSDQDEDAFDHMNRVMASQGGHLVVVGEVIKERDAALAEVERLRRLCVDYSRRLGDAEHDASLMLAALRERDEARREVKRLRDRLRELEWADVLHDKAMSGECPVCWSVEPGPHDPDCWLWQEIRSIRESG